MSIAGIIAEFHGFRQLPRVAYGVLAGAYGVTLLFDGFHPACVCAAVSYTTLAIFSHAQAAPGPSPMGEVDEESEAEA